MVFRVLPMAFLMFPDKDRAVFPGLLRPFMVYINIIYLISEWFMDKIKPVDVVNIPCFVVFFLE